VVLQDAEPFLLPIGREWKAEAAVVEEIAAVFGMAEEVVAADFSEFLMPLIAEGFVETTDSQAKVPHETLVAESHAVFSNHGVGEGTTSDAASTQSVADFAAQGNGNFDMEGRVHDESWTPVGDFFEPQDLPVQLHVDLTAACTERCVHCYLPDYPVKHLPFELAEKVLREFRAMQGLTVHLTGGECMLHPQFERICLLCRELNLNFVILSNLTACDEKRIAFLAQVQPQFVNVSLYSMDEREHDAITRLPGSWRRTMDAIRRCEAAGVPIRLAAPLLKENKGAFRALANFAREHRTHLVPSIDIVPQSDHDCSNLDHACSSTELREVLVANKEIFGGGWERTRSVDADAKVCDIGRSRIYLNSSGNYYPCDSMHGYVLGNAAVDTLEEVWLGEKMGTLRRLRNRDFPECFACANRRFCKLCPAFNFNSTGNVFKSTPAKCAIAAVLKEVYGKR
jgi:radical SAM protein with 4Fe4S-binding SPASM domain